MWSTVGRRPRRRLAGSSPRRDKCLARGLQQTLESSRSGTNALRAVPLGTLRKADLEASPHRLSASPEGLLLSLVGAEGARRLPLNDHLVDHRTEEVTTASPSTARGAPWRPLGGANARERPARGADFPGDLKVSSRRPQRGLGEHRRARFGRPFGCQDVEDRCAPPGMQNRRPAPRGVELRS